MNLWATRRQGARVFSNAYRAPSAGGGRHLTMARMLGLWEGLSETITRSTYYLRDVNAIRQLFVDASFVADSRLKVRDMDLFDEEEFHRWFDQAEHTLESAQRDLSDGDYGWSCFKAQQAGEYALKGLLYGLGKPAFGHSTVALLEALAEAGIEVEESLKGITRRLDRHYIPTRYANAYSADSPFRYDEGDAQQAVACTERSRSDGAKEIVDFASISRAQLSEGD